MPVYLKISCVILAAYLGCNSALALAFPIEDQQSPTDYQTIENSFSDDDLVRILGRLSEGENGIVSKEEIENEFNFTLPHVDQRRLAVPPAGTETFGTTSSVNGYFDMLYEKKGATTSFSFGLGSEAGTLMKPMAPNRRELCVNMEKISPLFAANGWSLYSTQVNPTFTAASYTKGYGRILLSAHTNSHCMISFLILSKPPK
jgi:hypothetical protein